MENKKKKFSKTDILAYTISGLSLIITIGMVIYSINTLKTTTRLNETYLANLNGSYELAVTLNEVKTLFGEFGVVQNFDEEVCESNAISGYVYGIGDKYAHYSDPTLYESEVAEDNESGLGLGILVIQDYEGIHVAKVYQNTPAELAGLQRFDIIKSVNGIEYTVENYEVCIAALKGTPGDVVNLVILRNGNEMDIQVEIQEYNINSVEGRIYNDIGIIDIDDFTLKSADEFIEIMDDFYGMGIENYIIDLRNNTGGYLETVVKMIDYIVPEGSIVKVTDNKNQVIHEMQSDKKEFNGQIVVLTNGWSASASELFAQSIKDFKKGITVGETTYGKGTVLGVYPLSNGGAVSISTGYYLTNSDKQIEGVGVEPDIEVDMGNLTFNDYLMLKEDTDPQFQAAIKYLRGEISVG